MGVLSAVWCAYSEFMAGIIETERMILREWEDADRAPFATINGDALVMEFLPRLLSEKDSDHLVDKFQKHFQAHGYGVYVMERKEDGAFMGFTGLNKVEFKADFTPATEIAWRLGYEYWGKGYASEAARGVLDYAASDLKLDEVVAFTVHDNTRSIGVMEKVGMVLDPDGGFDYPTLPEGHPLGRFVLYRK